MKLELEGPRAPATARIVVIHPTPVIRLGIARALELAYSTDAIDSFANLSLFDSPCGAASLFSAALIDAHEWSAHGLSSGLTAMPVGLISAAGSTPSVNLLRARGLRGAVPVTAGPEEFLAIVNALVAGRDYFSAASGPGRLGLSRLTQRQFEILEMMTRGLLNKQIAGELRLSEPTVKAHVSSILMKLNCNCRTQAAAAYMKLAGLGG